MIENMVIVKDGESVFIGGLTRLVDEKTTKRFPLLGHILPFIFSNEVTYKDEIESIIILTPRVVDFNTTLDEKTMEMIEG